MAAYNYSGSAGDVGLALQAADWYSLVDDVAQKNVAVESGKVAAAVVAGGGGGGGSLDLPDLVTTVTASKTNGLRIGDRVTVTLSVMNKGKAAASGVHLLVSLPETVIPRGIAKASRGPGCRGVTVIDCDLGSLGVGSTATVKLPVSVASGRQLFVAGTAQQNQNDATLKDNVGTLQRQGTAEARCLHDRHGAGPIRSRGAAAVHQALQGRPRHGAGLPAREGAADPLAAVAEGRDADRADPADEREGGSALHACRPGEERNADRHDEARTQG